MTKTFKKAKFVGLEPVITLKGTKKEMAKLKDEAMPLGAILFIDEDLNPVSTFYKVGAEIIEVQNQGISRSHAERIMNDSSDYYVHGYIKSGTIFDDAEVLIRIELINYGLYTAEDTAEDCVDDLEEDTAEDCVDDLEEDTAEDCVDDLEEDTSEDYTETTNVHGVPIKNYCLSFKEAMLIHEAVEDNLVGFLGDLSLERWDLFDSDIDCTLCLDEQYNNMVTGFIVFGAVLNIFTFDATRSKGIYLNYLERTYNLSKWEVKELSNLIDLGINLNSSVIEPHSYKLIDCLILFIRAVYSSVCFESHRNLYFDEVVKRLKAVDCFDRAVKFYLTIVCWGKLKPVYNIYAFDYPPAIENYNADLELFDRDDMYAVLVSVAEDFNLDTELIERYSDDDISKDTAINILYKWGNPKNKKLAVLSNNEQIKLKVLDHVIKKLKGEH